MEKFLGLLLLVVYIAAIVGLAAGVTFAVVKIFPTQRTPAKPSDPDSPSPTGSDESIGGRLFRRAKRAAT